MTLASLRLILGVLEPKTNKEELMENEEEEEGEDGGGEASGDGSGGGDSCSEGEGSEMDDNERGSLVSGEGEESDDDEAEEVDPVFRAEVQKALGAAAVDSDAEVHTLSS